MSWSQKDGKWIGNTLFSKEKVPSVTVSEESADSLLGHVGLSIDFLEKGATVSSPSLANFLGKIHLFIECHLYYHFQTVTKFC